MKIKPCPFCGCEAKTKIGGRYFDCEKFIVNLTVKCQKCDCGKTLQIDLIDVTFDELMENCKKVIEVWNTRKE